MIMPDEVMQMRQMGEALAEQPARPQLSYWGRVVGTAWAYVTSAGPRSHHDQRPDGLEAFDILGGWKGSDAGRRR